jgi:GPH family glycoside/pentoside/hexuronide:cation symporter
MMGLVPAAAALISGLFMIFYKLSDQKMTQIIADLESQRAAENS